MAAGFETEITTNNGVLSGPFRKPANMLVEQEYGGHKSIHDDAEAERLGFVAGPVEGPTHFSQFVPLLAEIWGNDWFERGCFSSHFKNMVVEGEAVKAFVEVPEAGARRTRCWAEKEDGTRVLEASATLGDAKTLLEERLETLRTLDRYVILEDMNVGMTGKAPETVRMAADQNMGKLYPFSLNEKLAKITENTPWYAKEHTPWNGAVIPLEMVSVLAEYSNKEAAWPVKGPSVGLYADLEIRMIDGPLMVGEDYILRREIAALSGSRRTESYWVETKIFDASGKRHLATSLLNHAVLKASYAEYPEELLA